MQTFCLKWEPVVLTLLQTRLLGLSALVLAVFCSFEGFSGAAFTGLASARTMTIVKMNVLFVISDFVISDISNPGTPSLRPGVQLAEQVTDY